MKIPVGEFGYRTAEPVRGPRPRQGPSAVAGALQEAGRVLGNLAEQEREQDFALARAKAGNALLDYEIAVKEKTADIQGRIKRGELDYNVAEQTYESEIGEIELPGVEGMDPITSVNFGKGVKRHRAFGARTVFATVQQAKRDDGAAQVLAAKDKLGKLAGMPGADIEAINARADLLVDMARAAGIPEDDARRDIQAFKDANWYNHATQRAMEAAQSPEALAQLQHDLTATDGFYAGKLDTDKRNVVLRAVLGDQQRLENKALHEADRREAKAARTIGEIEKQIAYGQPATAEMWAAWGESVRGTAAESEFAALQQSELEVQDMLRRPIEEQQDFIAQREAELAQKGGTVADMLNVNRLKTAFAANVKQMQEEPLQFAAKRTGAAVEPLDLQTAMTQPEGPAALTAQLQDRMTTLTALRGEYGDAVQLKPLLAPEADFVSRTLKSATPQDQGRLLGMLRMAAGDSATYQAIVAQIAPALPVVGLAGMRMAAGENVLLHDQFGSGNDISRTGPQVAETMLLGQSLLSQESKDGQPKAFKVPEPADFDKAFDRAAEGLFAGNPAAYMVAEQAVRAYYVGAAAQRGTMSTKLSDELFAEAFKAAIGSPVEVRGVNVLPPWGMGEDAFLDAIQQRAALAIQGAGYDRVRSEALLRRAVPRNFGDGTYRLVFDGEFVTDPRTGRDLVIDLKRQAEPTAPAAPAAAPPPKAAAKPRAALEEIPLEQRRELAYNAPELDSYAAQVEQKYGLPTGLITALKNAGEKSPSKSVSRAGARGVMQFMPANLDKYGVSDATDPLELIDAAGQYLRDTMKQYGGNVDAVIADYNGGPRQANLVLAGKQPKAAETRKYLARVRRWLATREPVTGGSGGARG